MSSKIFTSVAMKKPKQSTFNMSHSVAMTGKMGLLLPCMAIDVLPGDYFRIGADALARFAPMLAPIMHRVDLSIHYFFVPNRLLWENWEQFITAQKDENGDEYIQPTIQLQFNDNPDLVKLADCFGIAPPRSGGTPENILAYPFSAYNLIYNEYYRDQNLIDELPYELVDGDNTSMKDNYRIRKRAWEHDYFTSCLPFAQKGQAVDLPLGDVTLREDWYDHIGNPPYPNFVDVDNNTIPSGPDSLTLTPDYMGFTVNGAFPIAYDPKGSLVVGSTTINDLRRAYRLQEWLEKNARGGTRYTEAIYSHFGVKSPDSRLQRPEYITGVKAPVIVSEVLNNTGPMKFWSETGGIQNMGNPQGDMAGHGTAVTQGKFGKYYAQEHGWIIGILSVMPKTSYMDGIPRMFTRKDFMDYAFPSFANIGEQEVQLREVYAYTSNGDDLFGYIPRYAEYKFMNSRVAGDFRNSLDFWHLARKFNSPPALNKEFIECTPSNRIFAVQTSQDNIWMQIVHKILVKRKLPFFGTPTI